MKYSRRLLLVLCVGLLGACSTTFHTAPIVDRTTGVRPVTMFEGKPGYHVVKKGDTLSSIGRTYKQSPRDIIVWNNLANPNDIKIDQIVRVVPPGAAIAETEAQTDSVQSRSVEVKPLSTTPAAAPVAINKTTPLGEKQPYSDATLAAMHKPDYAATAAPAGKPVVGEGAKPVVPVVAPGKEDENISWQWPADGKIIATFAGTSKGIDIAGKAGQKVSAAADG